MGTSDDERETKRVQFDFDQELIDELDDFVKFIGAASRAEAVRRAIRFTNRILRELKSFKKRMYFEDPKGTKERIDVIF